MPSEKSAKGDCTRVSSTRRLVKEMVLAFNFGLMAPVTKGCGSETKRTATAACHMPMEICMKEGGLTIKPMARVFSLILQMQDMRVTGLTTCSMATERNNGTTELLSTRASSIKERRMALGALIGTMEVTTLEASMTANSKDLELTILLTLTKPTKVNLE